MVENNGTSTTTETVSNGQHEGSERLLPIQGYGGYQENAPSPVPNYNYAQLTAAQNQTRKIVKILYSVMVVGLVLAAVLGVFLPWGDLQLTTQGATYKASINGFGQFSGDPVFAAQLQQHFTITLSDGPFILFFSFLIAVLILTGFFTPGGWFAIGIFICGAICTYTYMTDLQSFYITLTGSGTSSGRGIALPVGLVGSIVIVLAAIAAIFYGRRLKKLTSDLY